MPAMPADSHNALDRRRFLAAASSVAAVSALGPARRAVADPGNPDTPADAPKIKLGVIGTGGRGAWIAEMFKQHGGFTLHALADYFVDRVNAAGDRVAVPTKRRFTGLSGYKRVLDSGVDAVAIISPPYFHPAHAAAAVDAGAHVYLAKPIAVDVPGCLSIEKTGQAATAAKRVMLVDFQTRAETHFIEAIARVHRGALGAMTFGEAAYHAGRLRPKGKVDNSPESRLRNWVFDIRLSGDIITEQNIHTLDVMSWIMGDKPPLSANATCGRKARVDVGDCNDHFAALYKYPGDIGVTFSSRQYNAFGSQPDGIYNRMFGSEGTLETKYGGAVQLRKADAGETYRGADTQLYKSGVVRNIADFHRAITEQRYDNPTVPPSVMSNLVTILGREAAYSGRTITWPQLMKMTDPIDANLEGLES